MKNIFRFFIGLSMIIISENTFSAAASCADTEDAALECRIPSTRIVKEFVADSLRKHSVESEDRIIERFHPSDDSVGHTPEFYEKHGYTEGAETWKEEWGSDITIWEKPGRSRKIYYLSPELFDDLKEKYPFIEYDSDGFSNPDGLKSMRYIGFQPQDKGLFVDKTAGYSLCTNFLGDCTGISAYNPETGHRFLGHVHFPNSSENFRIILRIFEKMSDDPSKLKIHTRTSTLASYNIAFVQSLNNLGYTVKLSAARRYAITIGSSTRVVGSEATIPLKDSKEYQALSLRPDGSIVRMIHEDTEDLFPVIFGISGEIPSPDSISEEDWKAYLEVNMNMRNEWDWSSGEGFLLPHIKLDTSKRPGIIEEVFFHTATPGDSSLQLFRGS